MQAVFKEIAEIVRPLQKYVYEENDSDIKISKLEARIDTLQELLLETQSDVVIIQKARARKRKPRKK